MSEHAKRVPFDTDALREVAGALKNAAANIGIVVSLEDPDTNAGLVNLAAQEIERLRSALQDAHEFIEAITSFYGHGLGVTNFHMNGDVEPFDNFIDENGGDDVLKTCRDVLGIQEEDTTDETAGS